jgi:hypothetical protein
VSPRVTRPKKLEKTGMNEIVERTATGRFVDGHRGIGGRPSGVRNRFSAAFVADVAEVWERHGVDVLERLVVEDPARFADICSRLVPKEVVATLEQRPAGGLDETDLAILRAIKQSITDVGAREPQEVFTLTLNALKTYLAKPILEG